MDLSILTDADLHDLSARIAAEWERRRASAVTDATVTEVITGLQDAGKLTPAPTDPETGEEQIIAWGVGQEVQPGDLRTHDGKTWRAKIDHVTHAGWPPSPATHTVWEPVT